MDTRARWLSLSHTHSHAHTGTLMHMCAHEWKGKWTPMGQIRKFQLLRAVFLLQALRWLNEFPRVA